MLMNSWVVRWSVFSALIHPFIIPAIHHACYILIYPFMMYCVFFTLWHNENTTRGHEICCFHGGENGSILSSAPCRLVDETTHRQHPEKECRYLVVTFCPSVSPRIESFNRESVAICERSYWVTNYALCHTEWDEGMWRFSLRQRYEIRHILAPHRV